MSLASKQQTEVKVEEAAQGINTEALRQILIAKSNKEVSHEDAKEIGTSLIEFFEVLATEEVDELDS